MQDGVAYAKLEMGGAERFVPLRQMLGVTSFGMNLILLQPGNRGRIHKHERQEEVYLVLEGTLTLAIEASARDLEKGEIARVAPDVRRQLINRGPGRLAVIAIGAAGEHSGRDGIAFASWDETQGAPPQQVPNPEDLPLGERRV
jgi:uncharacterized cupin superfamily protein